MTDIVKKMEEANSFANSLAEAVEKRYIIAGHTMKHWEKEFRVEVPPDATPGILKDKASQILSLFHDASFRYLAAEALVSALECGKTEQYEEAFLKIKDSYEESGKKCPAAETIKTTAEATTSNIRGALSSAKIQKNFWKKIVDELVEKRKIVKVITDNNNQEIQLMARKGFSE